MEPKDRAIDQERALAKGRYASSSFDSTRSFIERTRLMLWMGGLQRVPAPWCTMGQALVFCCKCGSIQRGTCPSFAHEPHGATAAWSRQQKLDQNHACDGARPRSMGKRARVDFDCAYSHTAMIRSANARQRVRH